MAPTGYSVRSQSVWQNSPQVVASPMPQAGAALQTHRAPASMDPSSTTVFLSSLSKTARSAPLRDLTPYRNGAVAGDVSPYMGAPHVARYVSVPSNSNIGSTIAGIIQRSASGVVPGMTTPKQRPSLRTIVAAPDSVASQLLLPKSSSLTYQPSWVSASGATYPVVRSQSQQVNPLTQPCQAMKPMMPAVVESTSYTPAYPAAYTPRSRHAASAAAPLRTRAPSVTARDNPGLLTARTTPAMATSSSSLTLPMAGGSSSAFPVLSNGLQASVPHHSGRQGHSLTAPVGGAMYVASTSGANTPVMRGRSTTPFLPREARGSSLTAPIGGGSSTAPMRRALLASASSFDRGQRGASLRSSAGAPSGQSRDGSCMATPILASVIPSVPATPLLAAVIPGSAWQAVQGPSYVGPAYFQPGSPQITQVNGADQQISSFVGPPAFQPLSSPRITQVNGADQQVSPFVGPPAFQPLSQQKSQINVSSLTVPSGGCTSAAVRTLAIPAQPVFAAPRPDLLAYNDFGAILSSRVAPPVAIGDPGWANAVMDFVVPALSKSPVEMRHGSPTYVQPSPASAARQAPIALMHAHRKSPEDKRTLVYQSLPETSRETQPVRFSGGDAKYLPYSALPEKMRESDRTNKASRVHRRDEIAVAHGQVVQL